MRNLILAAFFGLAAAGYGVAEREGLLQSPLTPAAAAPAASVESAHRRPDAYPGLGKPIPQFTAAAIDGAAPLTEADLKGRWTVVLFWGSWCGDCQRDAAHTLALARALEADPAVDFKSIHVDARTGRYGSIEAYFEDKGGRFPVWLDADRSAYGAFGIAWVPSYLVVDPQGVVRGFRTDLNLDASAQGGVKAFVADIARLRGEGA